MVLTDVGLISHIIAVVSFLALAIVASFRQRRRIGYVLALASGLTALWALVFVLAVRGDVLALRALTLAETLRTTAWIGFLIALLRPSWQLDERTRLSFILAGGVGFIVALQLVLDDLVSPAPPMVPNAR